MVELNAGAPLITDRLCDAVRASTSPASGRTSTRSASPTASSRASSAASTTTPGPRSRSIRAASPGQQSALGGGGRYDGLVELLGGRPTPGHRVRARPRPDPPRPRGAGRRRRPPSRRRVAVVVGADPAATAERLRIATRSCARPGSRPAPSSASASSASSSSRPPASGPTSRSSSATSWPTARSSSATSRPARQKLVALDDLVRELERARSSHHHGPRPRPDDADGRGDDRARRARRACLGRATRRRPMAIPRRSARHFGRDSGARSTTGRRRRATDVTVEPRA